MSEKEIYKKVGQFSIVKSGENSASIDNNGGIYQRLVFVISCRH